MCRSRGWCSWSMRATMPPRAMGSESTWWRWWLHRGGWCPRMQRRRWQTWPTSGSASSQLPPQPPPWTSAASTCTPDAQRGCEATGRLSCPSCARRAHWEKSAGRGGWGRGVASAPNVDTAAGGGQRRPHVLPALRWTERGLCHRTPAALVAGGPISTRSHGPAVTSPCDLASHRRLTRTCPSTT